MINLEGEGYRRNIIKKKQTAPKIVFLDIVDYTFITYLYKEHIRKPQECDISLRFHYSLVFDLSPTLRQIASTPLFLVTRNAKHFSVYLEQKWHKIYPSTYNL